MDTATQPPPERRDPRWRDQTRWEELANGATHGIGAALALAGAVYLLVWSATHADAWRIVGSSVYGVTLVLLYVASTVYHSVRGHRLKSLMQRFDRSAIFLFIAGCYTPFTLVPLRGGLGITLLSVIWGLAALGITLEWALKARFTVISTWLYLGMGWLMVLAMGPMAQAVEPAGLGWLVGGGVSYSVGVLFFWWTRLPFHHTIWHLFVLGGTACHFQAISGYVLPLE